MTQGITMRRLLMTAAVAALLAGCAPGVWVREGATQADFAHDRAVCDYQSELGTPSSSTYSGGGTMSDAIADGIVSGIADGMRKATLMNKCMAANGWTLERAESLDSPSPTARGDSTTRVVVGPPGSRSILDGTGRYLGPAE